MTFIGLLFVFLTPFRILLYCRSLLKPRYLSFLMDFSLFITFLLLFSSYPYSFLHFVILISFISISFYILEFLCFKSIDFIPLSLLKRFSSFSRPLTLSVRSLVIILIGHLTCRFFISSIFL